MDEKTFDDLRVFFKDVEKSLKYPNVQSSWDEQRILEIKKDALSKIYKVKRKKVCYSYGK